MRISNRWVGSVLAVAALSAMPATAKVIDQSEIGFTVAHTANVAATPEDVWKMLRMPQKWWSKAHSWSGNAEISGSMRRPAAAFARNFPATVINSGVFSTPASSLPSRVR